MEGLGYPKDPSIHMLLTVDPEIYKCYLHWAMVRGIVWVQER